MNVAVLFSGGKDSTLAIHEALNRGWNVKALIAVKPKNTEAYLWHYATVELTKLSSKAMNLPLHLIKSKDIGPDKETKELDKLLSKLDIDAILLGGVGLQKTQINAVAKVAKKHGIDVIVPHANLDHLELVKQAINLGFDIRITSVATDGLDASWLGKKIDKETLKELEKLSKKFGFHIGFEGGYADTFVCDAPIFKKKVEFIRTEKVWDDKTHSGYLVVNDAKLVNKS